MKKKTKPVKLKKKIVTRERKSERERKRVKS